MSSTSGDILTDICQTLRTGGEFAAVTIGPDNNAARWPRVEVILVSVDETQADDTPEGRWCTLKAKVCIHIRCDEPAEAFARALDLAESASEALLADRFRSQSCLDLPVGKATSIGPLRVEPKVKEPYLAVAFEVLCNFLIGQVAIMERYGAITDSTFGETSLSGPISVRLARRAEPTPMSSDSDVFVTSVQLGRPVIGIEIRIGDTAAAEGLSLGQTGVLSIEIAATSSGQTGRTISITNAVLTGIEFQYEQSAPAVAKLTFTAEASDGDTDPFTAQEAQI